MKEKIGKILGTLLFVVLISCLFYLIFLSNKKNNKGEIKMIELTGNHLLSEKDYLSFARLGDNSKYGSLTLPEIKNRFASHPYVLRVDVEDAGNNEVKVFLTEKNVEAVLLAAGEPNFITDDFQVLPIFPDAKFSDLPVISNPGNEIKIKPLSYLKSGEIVEAFKIIEASKLTNESMYKKLSEINLRNGGDVVLSFTGLKPPVLFGHGEAAKKMVYLDLMWNSPEGNNLIDSSEYIDLRFADEIFVGSSVAENNSPGDASKTGLGE